MDSDSDNTIDTEEHKRLVDNVLNLNTRQYVNKPTRTELTTQISEYNLIKSLSGTKDAVRLHDLTKALKDRAGDVELRKKVKKAEVKSKTLPKPLEKPQAERIRRSTAYENVKEQLNRWDSVVQANRVSTNLSFPLKDQNLDNNKGHNFTADWVVKSKLEKELEKYEPKTEVIHVETDTDLSKMTLKEMIEKRKEMAKLRRYQSYKEIKARWQNKIKSKTFRRIQRKEKTKEQMKEFELLQKTNPEAALKKLEEIEKARAGERASLRHKSTGKWAKNHQIRAKYDKESRKALAEQLAISKDLMQKQQVVESSESASDDSEDDISNDQNGENPWTNKIKPSKEVLTFVSDYKKFWETQNSSKVEPSGHKENTERVTENLNTNGVTLDNNKTVTQETVEKIDIDTNRKRRKRKLKDGSDGQRKKLAKEVKVKCNQERNKDMQVDSTAAIWEVSSLDGEIDNIIDDVFSNIECKIKDKVDKKLQHVQSKLEDNLSKLPSKNNRRNCKDNEKDTRNNINCKNSNEELSLVETDKLSIPNRELPRKQAYGGTFASGNIEPLKLALESKAGKPLKVDTDLQRDKFINMQPVNLDSSTPDVLSYDDNEEGRDQAGIIMEAFEDTDIVEDFKKDKKDVIDSDRPKDIDLSLPGWGSWGGKDLPIPKKKKRRFIIKAPKQFPRKDMNKGNLIINESANDKAKPHLVNDVPFPFKTVKDFEANLRAPIGNTFVPETAFRRMIKAPLVTKIGAIIEPITEDILLNKEKKKGNVKEFEVI